ncbi:MAG TPA: carboxypeptidase regulatory-like domain-containing protein [Polyangiaceae bacterium]
MRITRTPVLQIAAAATAAAALVLLVARPGVPAPPGAVGGKVTVIADGSPKGDASSVVVYLEGIAVDPQPLPTTPQVHQRDQQFAPELTVVTRGSTIAFPNDDKIFHNVFSVSEPARFDLGLYKSGESKSVQFDRPGVVDVYCNIHPQMAAKIKVLDTPYYALTANNGSFFIPNVPPGTYPIVAWQPYGAEYRGSVTVAAGGTATVSIQLTEGEKARHHLRKDGQPYGRYK